ncbi:hypothetical protein [Pseudoalteromonas sp. OF7H-1]|uniref:hypothetical protein n=1 Tax=Pseudoalteromonas sp. OF7H-1 TaxID=2917755 RepID=UPI001EF725A3|nr:hypothetical protein [Pseudoalteromonas sp. OF7H-1]MCG7539212.1 hypothetical protein [Pseudoalteromonas sp. OF7H-1]
MKAHERAAQIWPVLSFAATNRQVLTYDIVGNLIGVPRFALAQLLEPIQSYCLMHNLPALTVLVVNKSGEPGTGFIAAADVSKEQQKVFNFDWLKAKTPSPEELGEAVKELPSCGIPEAAKYSESCT